MHIEIEIDGFAGEAMIIDRYRGNHCFFYIFDLSADYCYEQTALERDGYIVS